MTKEEKATSPRPLRSLLFTCGTGQSSLLGGRWADGALELRHAAQHVAQFGPHEEAAAVPAGPRALQESL